MNRIAELRKGRDMTQQELGDFVGKSKYAISKWEVGENEPSQADIVKLCEVLGADAEYLMGHSEINTRRIELRGEQIPGNLRDAGLDYVQMLREYVDEHGGIREDVQKELLRLVAEAKILPSESNQSGRRRKRPIQK